MDVIGNIARQALAGLTHSKPHSAKSLAIRPIPGAPTTEAECSALEAWAAQQSDIEEPATRDQLATHLQFIAATLPSKTGDALSAKQRVAVYAKILERWSDSALSFMTRRVLETEHWFPPPAKCLEILEQYRKPLGPRSKALGQCSRFRQERMEAWLGELKAGPVRQDFIDAAPLWWRKIAETRGYLRLLESGQFRQRNTQVVSEKETREGTDHE